MIQYLLIQPHRKELWSACQGGETCGLFWLPGAPLMPSVTLRPGTTNCGFLHLVAGQSIPTIWVSGLNFFRFLAAPIVILLLLVSCQPGPGAPEETRAPIESAEPTSDPGARSETPGALPETETTTEATGIPLEIDQEIPPIPPLILGATAEADGNRIRWQGTGSDIDTEYRLHRRALGEEDWQIIATIPTEGDNRGEYQYLDTTIQGGTSYEYAIDVIDIYDNQSDLSESILVEGGT